MCNHTLFLACKSQEQTSGTQVKKLFWGGRGGGGGGEFVFMLFNDTWSQVSVRTFGVMYDHIYLNLQITRSDIGPHIKWAVSLVFTYGHFHLPQGFVWGFENLAKKSGNSEAFFLLHYCYVELWRYPLSYVT